MSKDTDRLPFTAEGYKNARAILEAEYGQLTEIVNSWIKLHYYLAFQKLINHSCILQLKSKEHSKSRLSITHFVERAWKNLQRQKNEVKAI